MSQQQVAAVERLKMLLGNLLRTCELALYDAEHGGWVDDGVQRALKDSIAKARKELDYD